MLLLHYVCEKILYTLLFVNLVDNLFRRYVSPRPVRPEMFYFSEFSVSLRCRRTKPRYSPSATQARDMDDIKTFLSSFPFPLNYSFLKPLVLCACIKKHFAGTQARTQEAD